MQTRFTNQALALAAQDIILVEHPELDQAGVYRIDPGQWMLLFTWRPYGVPVQVYGPGDLDLALSLARDRYRLPLS